MTQPYLMPAAGSWLTLPANAAVIRMLAGDSLAGGTVSPANTPISDLGEDSIRNGAAATTVQYAADAYYWDKWLRLDDDEEWSGMFRNLEASEAANAWAVLHDRTGYNGGPAATAPGAIGTAYADLGDAPSLGLLWCMHHYSNVMPRYRTANGDRLPIHYLMHSTSSSLVGDYVTNENVTWSPTHATGLFEMWQANYVAPAVNALRAAGYEVFIESMFFTAGGADQSTAGGTPGAENLGQGLLNFLTAAGKRSGGRIPTVMVRPYYTAAVAFPLAEADLAKDSFDAVFDAFGDAMTDYIRMEGIPTTEATKPGIHPTADGLVMMAQRYAEAIGRLASRGARLVHVTGDLA
jgi:hypothetical protein